MTRRAHNPAALTVLLTAACCCLAEPLWRDSAAKDTYLPPSAAMKIGKNFRERRDCGFWGASPGKASAA
jgi:hypothetical protein